MRLVHILDTLVQQDGAVQHFGRDSVARQVCEVSDLFTMRQLEDGLNFLVYVGVLDPTRRGRQQPGYRRQYWPGKKSAITAKAIQDFRKHKHSLRSDYK